MKLLAISIMTLFWAVGSLCTGGQSKPADHAAVEVIRKYIKAGDQQDIDLYNQSTHPDFRVIAGDYPKPGKATIMSRDAFGSLLSDKKIGGDPRRVEIQNSQSGGSSTAEVALTMTGSKLKFNNLITVVRTSGGWKVLQDRAIVTPIKAQ